jgi:miniconductance mechanosensitive channel
MHAWLRSQLETQGLGEVEALAAATLTLIAAVLIIAWIADGVTKRYLLRFVRYVSARSDAQWDDVLVEHGVFSRLAQLAPGIVIYTGGSAFGPSAEAWVERLAFIYMIVVMLLAVSALLDAGLSMYQRTEVARERPVQGYLQVMKIVLYIIAGIFIVATLLDEEPWGLLTGLGAVSAILLLVFRDTILSFVASVQVATQNMVRRGDWIEMPSYGADGDVIEVSLHTVRVQNWDKTISTVPIQALITDSFKNWRGMEESGGRRIKRSLRIDLNTIRFCDDALLERLEKFDLLAGYLRDKGDQLAETNASGRIGVNQRRLTNVGTFRAYMEAYLRGNANLHSNMTFLVRQLPPTETGLPIEIYVFSQVQAWAEYEAIQADIFDHLFAVLPEFGLRAYQAPSGHDLHRAAEAVSTRAAV